LKVGLTVGLTVRLTVRQASLAVVGWAIAVLIAGCAGPAEIKPGDCFARGTARAFDFAAQVTCDEPHSVEVVAKAAGTGELATFRRAELDVADSRARQLYRAEVTRLCEPAWSSLTGYDDLAKTLAPGATVLPALYGDLAVEAVPADQWDGGDRTLICYQVFGRPGFEGETAVEVSTRVLPDLIRNRQVPLEVRDCAVGPSGDRGEVRVPCADPHDREYVGHLNLAQFVGAVPELDQAFLDQFDSQTAENSRWAVLDGLCDAVFSPLLGAERPDISLVSQVYTAEPDWGWAQDGAYHAACFAQTEGSVTGSVVGIGEAPLTQG
jgi:Septum formation